MLGKMVSIRGSIEQETEDSKQRYGTDWSYMYFNNWINALPDGLRREAADFLGILDIPFGEEYPGETEYSELFRNQTMREFFEIVDTVLEEEGISIEEVKRLQRLRNEWDGAGDPILIHLNGLTLPTFIRLREMGYKRYPDLVV